MPEPAAYNPMTVDRCRFCGCTHTACSRPVDGPCYWVEPDLCSNCLGRAYVAFREQFRELLDVLGAFGRSGSKAMPMFGGLSVEMERIASELPGTRSDFPVTFVVGEEFRLAADESLEFPVSAGSVLGSVVVGEELRQPGRDVHVRVDPPPYDPSMAEGFDLGARVRQIQDRSAPAGTIEEVEHEDLGIRWDDHKERGFADDHLDVFTKGSAYRLLEVVE